jgi:hypothetical protein
VYHCDFEAEHDRNFDRWPDRWTRRTGHGYPHYVRVQITEEKSYSGKHCLQVELDGGGAEVSTPLIDVDAAHQYLLSVQLRCEGLQHNRAWVSLALLNSQRQVVARWATPPLTGTGPWQHLTLPPVALPTAQRGYAVVSLHVEPSGPADLQGRVLLDDVQLIRLPRLQLRTAWPLNVVASGELPRVDWQVSGYEGRRPVLVWEVHDALGRPVARPSTIPVKHAPGGESADETTSAAGSWALNDAGPGFYRVRATLAEAAESGSDSPPVAQQELALTVLAPRAWPPRGRGIWTLPAHHALTDDAVLLLSQHAALRAVKVPTWLEPDDQPQAESLLTLGQRLAAKGVDLVGIVDLPPASLRDRWGLGTGAGSSIQPPHTALGQRTPERPAPLRAVDVFSLDPQEWFPSFAPMLTRLSLAVDRWQLGADDDTSFGRLANGQQLEALGAALQRLLRSVNPAAQVGLPWDAARPVPEMRRGDGWSFVMLSADASGAARWQAERLPPGQTPTSNVPPESNLPTAGVPSVPAALSTDRALATTSTMSMPAVLPAIGPLRRWVGIRPLERSAVSPQQRAANFALQLVEAHAAEADAVVLSHPLDPEWGVLQADGTPGELFLPWRYLTQALGEARFAGRMHLPGGSHTRVFLRDDEALVLLWNQQPATESVRLGPHAAQYDLWGRTLSAGQHGSSDTFLAGPVPTIIAAADPRIVQLHVATRIANPHLEAQPGVRQTLQVRIPNVFGRGVSGTVRWIVPEGWRCPRPHAQVDAPPGADLVAGFEVRLPLNVETGRQLLALEIDLQAESAYSTRVYQPVWVGQEWLHLELDTQWRDTGELVVRQRFSYAQDEPASLLVEVFAPDEPRRQFRIRELRRGQYEHEFEFADGARLRGQTLWIRVEDVVGKRIVNRRIVVPP